MASSNTLGQRWRHWWQSRLPRSDTLTLTQRNVYILPSGAGAMLVLTLLVLLLASINFQLNLGYLLTFLLLGSSVAGMYLSHASLRGLQLHLQPPQPQFLGSNCLLHIQLHNPSGRPRYGIGLALHDSGHWAWTDVPAQASADLHIGFSPQQRGWQSIPLLTAQTRYPLGSFRVWCLWRAAAQVLIYPRPEHPAPPLPPGQAVAGHGGRSAPGMDEYDGVRAYQRGDPLKLIVWKKAAKTWASGSGSLISRQQQHHSSQQQLWLDYAQTGLHHPEERLSRLTAWVLQAERLGLQYGLRLPGQQIAQDSGAAQRQRCLQALALYRT